MGPAVGGILADTVGIRAPFTFTGAAAALAALYGLIRLPETGKRVSIEAPRESESSAILQNNAVPAMTAGSPVKVQLAEQALVGNRGLQQLGAADELRQGSHANVRSFSFSPDLEKSASKMVRTRSRNRDLNACLCAIAGLITHDLTSSILSCSSLSCKCLMNA